MKGLAKRYRIALALIAVNLVLAVFEPAVGLKSITITADNLKDVFFTLPPIFVLLGLMDVWVPRETMTGLMGENSGAVGMIFAFLLGSIAAGPLYAAFPIAAVLLKKGSSFVNAIIFLGAWSTTKIPLLLFEASSMGWAFMLARFAVDIPGIILIAFCVDRLLPDTEKQKIYTNINSR